MANDRAMQKHYYSKKDSIINLIRVIKWIVIKFQYSINLDYLFQIDIMARII